MLAPLLVALCTSASPYVYEPVGDSGGPGLQLVAGAHVEQLMLAGGDLASSTTTGAVGELALLVPVDTEGTSFGLGARLGRGEAAPGRTRAAAFARLRAAFGAEAVATFVDLDAGVRLEPITAALLRVGFGVDVDLAGPLGTWAAAGASIGWGERLQATGDLGLGLRLRI